MDCARLDELMTIKKKGDTNKDNKHDFQREMMNLMSIEGYSERVEDYLYNGFSFIGSVPIFEFMKSLQDRERNNFYFDITRGKRFHKDQVVSLKLELHLFALMCNELPREYELISNIIKVLPKLIKNKDGSKRSDLSRSLEKYLLVVMDENIQLPALNSLNLEFNNILDFREMITEGLKNYQTEKKSITRNMAKIHKWLATEEALEKSPKENQASSGQYVVGSKNTVSHLELGVRQSHQEDKSSEIQNSLTKGIKEKKDVDNQLKEISWKDCIIVVEKHVSSLEKQIEDLNSKLIATETKKTELIRKIEILHSEIERLNFVNIEMQKKSLNLMEEKRGYQIQVENLSESVDQKKQEIESQKQLIEMVSRDHEKQLEEFVNRLSSKLKVDYKDLMDVLNTDMTVDLGENMRLQLLNVFEILEKSGICFK